MSEENSIPGEAIIPEEIKAPTDLAKPRKNTGKLGVKADVHEDNLAGYQFVKDRNDRIIRVPADATGNKISQRVFGHSLQNQFSRYLDVMCVEGICKFTPKEWKSLADTAKVITDICEAAYETVKEEQATHEAPNQMTEVLIRVRQLALAQHGGKAQPMRNEMKQALEDFAIPASPNGS